MSSIQKPYSPSGGFPLGALASGFEVSSPIRRRESFRCRPFYAARKVGKGSVAKAAFIFVGFLQVLALFSPALSQASFTFTNDPLTSQVTPVKAVHITELRQAIDTLRSRNGLGAFTYTDSALTVGVTQIKAVHVTELRTALNGVYDALGRTRPTYTDATLTAGQTVIKAAHITEVRNAVRAADLFILTVGKSGAGSGTVTSSPTGINCGTDCTEPYAPGTVVTLTATAASGSVFGGWSGGGCTGTGTCTVTMNAAQSVTATFNVQASQSLTVTLVKKGTSGAFVGVPNIEVGRHDPTTGAFLESRITDLNGVAAFVNIGSARTTVSIILPDFVWEGMMEKSTIALLNIPTGNITFKVGDEQLLTTYNLNVNNLPTGSIYVRLQQGGEDIHRLVPTISGTTASFAGIELTPDNVQSDGKFSIIAEAMSNTNSILGCGALLDQLLPASGQTLSFNVGNSPASITFSASEPVLTRNDVRVHRKGVLIEFHPGNVVGPSISGTIQTCANQIPGPARFGIFADALPGAAMKGVGRIFTALPASVDFTIPDRSIDTLSRSGGTVSWTSSGTAAADGTGVDIEWISGTNQYSWEIFADPSVTSGTLPTLPTAFADRNVVPSSGVSVRVGEVGLDTVTGFDDLISQISAANGDYDSVEFKLNATESFDVSRALNVLLVDPVPTGGRITANVGGINCGTGGAGDCMADNILSGTSVTLTATPASGFSFTGWTGEEAGSLCGGPTPPNPCTFTMDAEGGLRTISATFSPSP